MKSCFFRLIFCRLKTFREFLFALGSKGNQRVGEAVGGPHLGDHQSWILLGSFFFSTSQDGVGPQMGGEKWGKYGTTLISGEI